MGVVVGIGDGRVVRRHGDVPTRPQRPKARSLKCSRVRKSSPRSRLDGKQAPFPLVLRTENVVLSSQRLETSQHMHVAGTQEARLLALCRDVDLDAKDLGTTEAPSPLVLSEKNALSEVNSNNATRSRSSSAPLERPSTALRVTSFRRDSKWRRGGVLLARPPQERRLSQGQLLERSERTVLLSETRGVVRLRLSRIRFASAVDAQRVGVSARPQR